MTFQSQVYIISKARVLGRARHRWKDLRETRRKGVDWIQLAQVLVSGRLRLRQQRY